MGPACFQKVGASPILSCLCSALSPLVEFPALGLPIRARWGPSSAHAAGLPRCLTPTSGTLRGGRLRNCCACTCALPTAQLSIRLVSALSCVLCVVCDMHPLWLATKSLCSALVQLSYLRDRTGTSLRWRPLVAGVVSCLCRAAPEGCTCVFSCLCGRPLREREREISIHIYIYMYIHIHI